MHDELNDMTCFAGSNRDRGSLLIVGTWSMKLLVYSIEDLKLITAYEIGGEIMPRRRVQIRTFAAFVIRSTSLSLHY